MQLSFVELLEDVLDNVEDAVDTLSVADGPIADPERAIVAEHITMAESRIALALDQIDNVGQIDAFGRLEELQDVADECVTLAQQALEEHASPHSSPQVIGSKLKTLRQLIDQPGGYRDLAGL